MNYQSYQPNYQNYQQFFQPYQQQIQQLQNQIPNIQQQMSTPSVQNGGLFYFVNSQKEAEDWVVGAGQTVFFFDRNNSIFYIKSVAQNGLSQPIEVYDYSQRLSDGVEIVSEPDMDKYITRDEFEALKAELEAMKEAEG
jgi:hypothetical protein